MDEPRRGRPPRQRALLSAVEASKAPAISRAAAVLRVLGKSDAPLGVQAIARELGLVPSTCLYVLRALVAEEFVAFDAATKRYALDAGVLTLAQHWIRRNRFSNLAQPALDRIAEAFSVTALGVHVIGLEHIVVVAVSQGGREFQLSTNIGSRFPALLSATGRCIAAFGEHSDTEVLSRFRTLRWDNPPSYEAWKTQVLETRREGVAVDAGHYMAGVTIIAAPVWRTRRKLSHALVAVGFESVLQRSGLPELREEIRSAAELVSSQLCGDEGAGA